MKKNINNFFSENPKFHSATISNVADLESPQPPFNHCLSKKIAAFLVFSSLVSNWINQFCILTFQSLISIFTLLPTDLSSTYNILILIYTGRSVHRGLRTLRWPERSLLQSFGEVHCSDFQSQSIIETIHVARIHQHIALYFGPSQAKKKKKMNQAPHLRSLKKSSWSNISASFIYVFE